MNTKYIFLDIDGTLVGYDAKVPPSAMQAIHLAQSNGHRVFIASGRARGIIYPWLLREISFDGIIAAGGAQVMLGDTCIFESVMSKDDLTFVTDYFHRESIYFQASAENAMYAEQSFLDVVIPAMYQAGYARKLVEDTYSGVIVLDTLIHQRNIEKISYFLSPHRVEKIREDLQGRFYVTDYSMGDKELNTYFGEMNLAGVDKASGIRCVLEATGAGIEDTIAIGDSRNDSEMLAYVGTSVAMGNATAPIKAMADMVTTPIDEDGIYNAFLKLGLI
ncbi:MAG: HAD family hydrolase [Clostridia bacterium]|nr:HAD family hydrolase [Clostridia bacterium]